MAPTDNPETEQLRNVLTDIAPGKTAVADKFHNVMEGISRVLITRDDDKLEDAQAAKARLDEIRADIIEDTGLAPMQSRFARTRGQLVNYFDRELDKVSASLGLDKAPKTSRLRAKPKFTHNPALHKRGQFTKLDEAIIKAFDDAEEDLLQEYAHILSGPAVDDYLRGTDPSNLGFLTIHKDRKPKGKKPASFKCKLWDFSDSISRLPDRKLQLQQIKLLAEDHLVMHVFEDHERFFIEKPTISARLRRRFPKLAEWGF